ncbi:MAG: hypothetical protein C0501_06510 [Isosphaera sp.]|nr:hypothetical protein [Isosphaera sp.]
MASPKKLVLFVEGPADQAAAPVLVQRLFAGRPDPPWGEVAIDSLPPFRVGGISGLIARDEQTGGIDFGQWTNYLELAARTRKNLGGVLLLLDGDAERVAGQPFCPGSFARMLAEAARAAGGGVVFSVAVVFLVAEYESLFLGSHETLPPLKRKAEPVPPDPERKRGAKEWLKKNLRDGYTNTADQERLTRAIDLAAVRSRMRSARRLEHALDELVAAVRSGQHVVSPGPAPPPAAGP